MKRMRGLRAEEEKMRIVRKIEEAKREGGNLPDICRAYGISRATFQYWRSQLSSQAPAESKGCGGRA